MTEEYERADRLARAVDAMIRGGSPESMDDQELEELLLIARIRRDVARTSAGMGAGHEATVWRRVMVRLRRRQGGASDSSAGPTEVRLRTSLSGGPSAHDIAVSEEVSRRLNRAAERAAPRGGRVGVRSVWRRLAGRLRAAGQGAEFSLNGPSQEGGESGPAAPARGASALGNLTGDLWSRLGPKVAVVGAAAALLVATLGPISTTGLADHPVAHGVRIVSEGAGFSGG